MTRRRIRAPGRVPSLFSQQSTRRSPVRVRTAAPSAARSGVGGETAVATSSGRPSVDDATGVADAGGSGRSAGDGRDRRA